jgi:hypothetical protein
VVSIERRGGPVNPGDDVRSVTEGREETMGIAVEVGNSKPGRSRRLDSHTRAVRDGATLDELDDVIGAWAGGAQPRMEAALRHPS